MHTEIIDGDSQIGSAEQSSGIFIEYPKHAQTRPQKGINNNASGHMETTWSCSAASLD